MGYKVENMRELVGAVSAGTVDGCAHCGALFERDNDYVYVIEIGHCPYCHEVITDVISDYVESDKNPDKLVIKNKVYEGTLEVGGALKQGYKVINKRTYEFEGLLSLDECVLWYVAESSLRLIKEGQSCAGNN